MLKEKSKDRPLVVDFYIGLEAIPSEWFPKKKDKDSFEDIREKEMFVYARETEQHKIVEVLDLPVGHHPGLRFEDITAHLMMQAMVYKSINEIKRISRVARQYANQAMKKVCRFCTHGLSCKWDSPENVKQRYTARGIGEKSSQAFVKNMIAGECAEKCMDCRVGRTIVVASVMDILSWGFKELDFKDAEIGRWRNKWYNIYRKLKQKRWEIKKLKQTVDGVIKSKRELVKQNAELRDALKENRTTLELAPGVTMEVTSAKITPAIGQPTATIEGEGKVTFDEFNAFDNKIDLEKVLKNVKKAIPDISISVGSVPEKKVESDSTIAPTDDVSFKDIDPELDEKLLAKKKREEESLAERFVHIPEEERIAEDEMTDEELGLDTKVTQKLTLPDDVVDPLGFAILDDSDDLRRLSKEEE